MNTFIHKFTTISFITIKYFDTIENTIPKIVLILHRNKFTSKTVQIL